MMPNGFGGMNRMPNMMGGNPMQMLQAFRSNPMQFLSRMNLNVPQNIMNDPQAIINHLLQTRQITQEQINSAYQMLGQFGRR